jgi:proteasome accessory factor C
MTAAPARRGAESAVDQVSRMLALVPYISRRPGVSISELAQEFGVGVDQITADLNLLMVCGEPGYYPNELIDVVLDEDDGTVSIAYDAGIDRPVRLSPDEAVTLTVALRALADLPDLVDADAVHSALAKLESAAGPVPAIAVAAADPTPALGTVRKAVESGYRLWMRYYTASRDELTEREVDPIRILVIDGHAYLEGYCYSAQSIRRFRVDRIDEVRMLDVPAQPPLWVGTDVPLALFTPGRDAPPVTLHLEPAAAWVAEYYLMDDITESADDPGALDVRMRASDEEWLIRLVLSLGAAATIVDRPDLAEQVAIRARAALAAYAHMPSPGGSIETAPDVPQ